MQRNLWEPFAERWFYEIKKSNSLKEYKRELISCTNLGKRLQVCGFNILKFWNKLPKNSYEKYGNDSSKIKKVKK